jgi:hypothetical protein
VVISTGTPATHVIPLLAFFVSDTRVRRCVDAFIHNIQIRISWLPWISLIKIRRALVLLILLPWISLITIRRALVLLISLEDRDHLVGHRSSDPIRVLHLNCFPIFK